MSTDTQKDRLANAAAQARRKFDTGQARAILGQWTPEQKVRFLDSLSLDPKFRADVLELLTKG